MLERTEYVENGVVQLRFADMDDSVMDLNAAEAAEVLQGMVEFTGQLARAGALGDGPPPEVRVRPPREGSSIWDFVIQWSAENPEVTTGAIQSAGAAVAGGLAYRFKMLRGARVKSFDPLPNGNMKVEWQDGEAQEVPAAAWSDFQKLNRRTKRTLQKILAPLGDDADIVQVRSGEASESSKEISEAPSVAEAGATEYRSASAAPDDEVVSVSEFEEEAQLQSIDFRPGEKWRVRTRDGARNATMEDEEFLRELDRGMALHKGDIFRVTTRRRTSGRLVIGPLSRLFGRGEEMTMSMMTQRPKTHRRAAKTGRVDLISLAMLFVAVVSIAVMLIGIIDRGSAPWLLMVPTALGFWSILHLRE